LDRASLPPIIKNPRRYPHNLSPIERLFANQTEQLERLALAVLDIPNDDNSDDISHHQPRIPKQIHRQGISKL
jgi:hypothetical protein